jgi:hypothetical protein
MGCSPHCLPCPKRTLFTVAFCEHLNQETY